MNILAHLYLSPDFNEVMLGNFIGDFVKGNKYQNYPEKIQKGILLHRHIDTITDKHPQHLLVRELFRPQYRLHSAIVADIVFDHFLASNWQTHFNEPLFEFTQKVHGFLNQNQHQVPSPMLRYMQSMIQNNWLVMYSELDGLEQILNGMSRNTSLPMQTPFAMEVIQKNYNQINQALNELLPDLIKLVKVK